MEVEDLLLRASEMIGWKVATGGVTHAATQLVDMRAYCTATA